MTTFDDGKRRRAYLLGDLAEEAQVSLEEEYLAREGTFDDLLMLESELVDEYLQSRLSQPERKLFERRLQSSARLRRRVDFGRTLAMRARRDPSRQPPVLEPVVGLRNLAALLASASPRFAIVAAVVLAVATALVWVTTRSTGNTAALPGAFVGSRATALPLAFEINRGQTDSEVRFLSRTQAYSVFLTSSEAIFTLPELRSGTPERSTRPRVAVLRMTLIGAHRVDNPRGLQQLPGRSHYFRGNEPGAWITDVARFARVAYDDVYDGIDLVYYGTQGWLEHDFIVAPGVNPNRIAMAFDGADRLALDPAGALTAWVADRPLRWERPVVYQERNGVRQTVSGAFALRENGAVGFEVGPYDETRPLTIDPVVVYGTYLGGAGFDAAVRMVVDQTGAAYLTGVTTSADFPLAGSAGEHQGRGQYDAFVAKLNAEGTDLLYSAYLGGSGDENFGKEPGIAVDKSGAAYLTGWTDSTDFPVTPGAVQTVPGRMFNDPQSARVVDRWPIFGHDDVVCCPDGIVRDAFITKLSPDGSHLAYSTYLGRNFDDEGQSITVDQSGHAYVVGYTASDGFPTTAGAFQGSRKGGFDIFAAKLSADGARLVYSTYIGGTGIDLGHPHAMDHDGNLFIVGSTYSMDFPVVNAAQTVSRGAPDGFVLKLDPTGSHLVYSTYLGGADEDRVVDIAVDSSGRAYTVGYTRSRDFPLMTPLQSRLRGTHAAFVTRLGRGGSVMDFSTLLDGSGEDVATAVVVDSQGRIYVTGGTRSADFPVSDNALQVRNAGDRDGYLVIFEPGGAAMRFATFFGGGRDDVGESLAIDRAGAVYVAGFTDSANFPVTRGSFQHAHGADRDAFVMKLAFDWLEPRPHFRRYTVMVSP